MDSDREINAIQAQNGILSTDPRVINKMFTSYYKILSTFESNILPATNGTKASGK